MVVWLALNCSIPGIYPDLLHICDLALYTDAVASAFLEWSDPGGPFEGRSRDERLVNLYRRYLQWCKDNRSLDNNIFSLHPLWVSTWSVWLLLNFLNRYIHMISTIVCFWWDLCATEECRTVPGRDPSYFNRNLCKGKQQVIPIWVKRKLTEPPAVWSSIFAISLHQRFWKVSLRMSTGLICKILFMTSTKYN